MLDRTSRASTAADVEREQEEQEQTRVEDRHRDAEHGESHDAGIEPGAVADGGQDAAAHAHDRGQQQRGDRQLDGARQRFEDAVEHRALAAQADAQVAMRGVAGVVPVLHPERPVQPELMPDLVGTLGGERLVAGKELDRIARHQVEHQEGHHRDTDDHRHRLRQAVDDIGDHACASTTIATRPSRRKGKHRMRARRARRP
jgi:hypothetical protein